MRITVELDKIVIDETGDLKQYQISQLTYYGFQTTSNGFVKISEDIVENILNVTRFFDEEKLSYLLSDNVSKAIEVDNEHRNKLQEIFKKANDIKNGRINNEEFEQFKLFLSTLPRKLKSHQIKAAYHVYCLKNGANFSVPGSGKTSVMLSVYEKLRLEGLCNTLFIIGPPSCFQPWKNEFCETIGRVPDSLILSGGNKSFRKSEYYRSSVQAHELYLSTFHTVLNDYKEIIKFISQVGINAFVIIDEAHYIKQLGGSWANSLLEIGRHAAFRGILTGTPIPKSYKDLFNLFDFLWEENTPISQANKIQIEIWEKKKNNEAIKALLSDLVGPLFYRVRKIDLGLKPAIFHEPVVVKMNETEQTIYNYIKAKIIELNQTDYFKNEETLNKLWRGRMMRLRQSVSNPGLLLSAIDDYTEKFIDNSGLQQKIRDFDKLEIPGKVKALIDIVIDLRKQNKKVLIWSNFIGTLKLIKSHFNALGENAELIYGKTPVRKDDSVIFGEEKTREDIRDEFLDIDSGLDILIANPAACAESISLHKTCFHAVYYDLSYNCAQYLQSLDRIHRVGGSEINEANYYFLQYENSIDQDIKQNLEAKAEKMYAVIEQDYNIYDLDIFEESLDDDVSAYKRLFINNDTY